MTTTAPPTQALRGPDPEMFRRSHYGARWYIDPLPADDRWPKTDDSWPSVTTVKKAWSKPFRKKLPTGETVPLDAFWAAEYVVDNRDAILSLDREGAVALVASAPARRLDGAAKRGTGVHTVLEDLAAGRQPLCDPEVEPFLPACEAFIREVRPTFLMTEVIAVNRSLGFAGTADTVLRVDLPGLGVCMVDYKSRGTDHGAYEEDAAQIGGYSLAEYLIVVDPETGEIRRVDPPEYDAGLVVSLTTEGYRLYPIDIELARQAFVDMFVTWEHRRDGSKLARKAIGNPIIVPANGLGSGDKGDVPAGTAADDAPAQGDAPEPSLTEAEAVSVLKDAFAKGPHFEKRRGWVQGRVVAIVNAGHAKSLALLWSKTTVPTFKAGGPRHDGDVDEIAAICTEIEGRFQMPFGDPDPGAPPQPTQASRQRAQERATKKTTRTKTRSKKQ